MGRTNVAITVAPGFSAGAEVTETSGDAGNDHKLANALGGHVVLFVENNQVAATVEVTVKAVAGTSASDIVKTIPATKTYCIGPLPASLYTQPSGVDKDYVQVNLDVDTTVKLYAVCF